MDAGRAITPTAALATCGLLCAAAVVPSCAVFGKVLSQPPTLVERPWQVTTLLVEPRSAQLGTPAVFVDHEGHPRVAIADGSFYAGAQSVALGRYDGEAWRLEFPAAAAPHRLCAAANADGSSTLTFVDLDGKTTAIGWDGEQETDAKAEPCVSLGANLQEATVGEVAHRLERAKDRRSLWHEVLAGEPCPPHDASPGQEIGAFAFAVDADGSPQAVLFEHPTGPDNARGTVRHAQCRAGAWTSSIIATDVVVSEVGLAMGEGGRAHVAYVQESEAGQSVRYATDAEGAPTPVPDGRDARVIPAVDACERLFVVQPPPLVAEEGVESYQSGDGFRCAVLQRDEETSEQALAVEQARCEEGNAVACAVAGSLLSSLMGQISLVLEPPLDGGIGYVTRWSGLRASGVPRDEAQAARWYGRGCDGGQVQACLFSAALRAAEDQQRGRLAKKACHAGLAYGCAVAFVAAGGMPEASELVASIPVYTRACDEGDAASCNNLGVALGVGGDDGGARSAYARACSGGVTASCRVCQEKSWGIDCRKSPTSSSKTSP